MNNESIFRKIEYFFYREWWVIKRWFKTYKLCRKTYDFDYGHSLDWFKFQLKRQIEFLESDRAMSLNAKSHAFRIRTFLNLMKKVYDDEYALEYIDRLKNEYGIEREFYFEPSDYEFNGEKTSTLEYRIIRNDNNYTETEIENIHNKLMKESFKKQERAHKLLWEFLEHNIQNWWD